MALDKGRLLRQRRRRDVLRDADQGAAAARRPEESGRPAPSCARRSSSTSKASTTRPGCTRRSGCAPRRVRGRPRRRRPRRPRAPARARAKKLCTTVKMRWRRSGSGSDRRAKLTPVGCRCCGPVDAGSGRRIGRIRAAGSGGRDLIGTCLRQVPRHCSVRPPRPCRPLRRKDGDGQHDELTRGVVVGVDAHTDTHDAAVLDDCGRLLGQRRRSRPTPPAIARCWRGSSGSAPIAAIGVESTGSYAAGLVRYLRADGRRGARGQPAAPAHAPAARQERPDRRRDGRPPRAGRATGPWSPKRHRAGSSRRSASCGSRATARSRRARAALNAARRA